MIAPREPSAYASPLVHVIGKSMSETEVDVVVLGAGIVGVSTAYAARQRGMSVVLVDRREPGRDLIR
ncbi:FAD-dependent oxidoreductase [Bradyrhizobium sp. TZ2]